MQVKEPIRQLIWLQSGTEQQQSENELLVMCFKSGIQMYQLSVVDGQY